MGLGDFLSDVGGGIAKGISGTANFLHENVEPYLNPFYGAGDPKEKEKGLLAPAFEKTVTPAVDETLSDMRYIRDNMVSQPISTVALVAAYNKRNSPWDSDPFKGSTWTRAWKAAEHISPFQALELDPSESEAAMDSKLLYYKPASSFLPPDFNKLPEAQQQQMLKEIGMPAVGNAYIEKKRANSAWYRYSTGVGDFSLAMFADPTTHGLGAAGKIFKAKTGMVFKAPKGGWSVEDINAIVNRPHVQALMKGIWENRDNPQLINNTELARKSGMGTRFGIIASKLQNEQELNLFVRTGMGDKTALDTLRATNAQIDATLMNMDNRLANLGLMRARYVGQPTMQKAIDAQMDTIQTAMNANAAMRTRYDEIMDNANQLDQLHVSRWSLQRAMDRTAAQNEYRIGPARGRRAMVTGTIQPGSPVLGSANYVPPPINYSVVHNRIFSGSDFFQSPLTLIRMVKNMHPNGYMDISMNQSSNVLNDSITELRGHLARIPGIDDATRNNFVNDYLKATTEHERKNILEDVGRLGSAKIAAKYGIKSDMADEIYANFVAKKYKVQKSLEDRYSAGVDPERMRASGQPMRLDEIPDVGGRISITPFTASRIMKSHTFQDLDVLDKALRRHGDKLNTLREAGYSTKDALEMSADYFSHMWKFTTLFRLGYIPRVLGDDLGSQIAAMGAAAMAVRGVRGVGNAFDNAARWIAKPALMAREANARAGAEYADGEMKLLKRQVNQFQRSLFRDVQQRVRDVQNAQRGHAVAQRALAKLNPADQSPKAMAVRQFAAQRQAQLAAATARHQAGASPGKTMYLNQLLDRHDFLTRYRDLAMRQAEEYKANYQKVIQGSQKVDVDGTPFPAAMEGRSGQYALDQISANDSVGNVFSMNKQLIQGSLERSFDHGGRILSATQNAQEHLKWWAYVLNHHIINDPLSRMAIKGDSIEDMTKWLERNPAGIKYRARLPKNYFAEDFARSAKYEVDQYMHTPEIRRQALLNQPIDENFLRQAVKNPWDRPDIHTGEWGASKAIHQSNFDRAIDKWYKVAATIPAERMSRHPLFNALYEGHVKRIGRQYAKQSSIPLDRVPLNQVEAMAHQARQLALRDTRKLVFDIAHRSDAAAATRFLSPFFAPTTEAFQRWGRVIADKPQVVGYAANWYNAPAYMGAMQDLDGNKVDEFGDTYIPEYPINPDTGETDYTKKPKLVKRHVPKSERYIITRMPKWVVNSPLGAALNIQESNGQLLLSQNSIDMVTQGDPWYNPGLGPIVQIPVNEFVQDKPEAALVARQLGILPFGVQGGGGFGDNPFGRAVNIAAPQVFKNLMTSMDNSDERYQAIKLQITNRAIYEHDQLHKPMPTAQQIADRVRNYWLFQAFATFVQPFATQRKDPYQFYYDQYRNLRNQNPLTADDEYLRRYEESHFVFASEISKSMGIPPTRAALDALKKWGPMVEQHPDLAPLLIGPEGRGPFSPEAYRYELNNPLVPGGAENMRTKLTAEEALVENRKRLGWAKYNSRMNDLTAQLHAAGFNSFEDDGAEDFKNMKRAWVQVYANPLLPDGTPNPSYNADWAEDFNTWNPQKYNAIIPALMDIAMSPQSRDPRRNDLRTLRDYLGARLNLSRQLAQLKADEQPATLDAAANEDIRKAWITYVDSLIEKSPSFGDLYHRYLSRDMGVDVEQESGQ